MGKECVSIGMSPVRPWTPPPSHPVLPFTASTYTPFRQDAVLHPIQQVLTLSDSTKANAIRQVLTISDSTKAKRNKRREGTIAKSGAVTERGPAKGSLGSRDKTRMGQDAAHASPDKTRLCRHKKINRQTAAPYVDIVGRHAQLDLDGSIKIPTRGGVRERNKDKEETGQRQHDSEEIYHQNMLTECPRDHQILRNYACWLHVQRRFKEAEKHFRAALAGDPFNVISLNAYAMLMWDVKKKSKAEDLLVMAIKADPRYVPALLNYAIINLHSGKLHSAIQYFSRVLDLERDLTVALLGCAVALEDLGGSSRDDIESIFLRVLNKEPANPEALHAYARFLKNRHEDVKADLYYTEALKVRPNDANILCSCGVFLMEQCKGEGDQNILKFENAAKCFLRVLELDDTNFEATYNCATLLSRWERSMLASSCQLSDSLSDLSLSGLSFSSSADRQALAESLFRSAQAMRPNDQDVLCSSAIFLANVPVHGEASILEAEHLFRRVLRANTRHYLAVWHLCQLLRKHRVDGHEKAAQIEVSAGLASANQNKKTKTLHEPLPVDGP